MSRYLGYSSKSSSVPASSASASAVGTPGKRTLTAELQYETAGTPSPAPVQCKNGAGDPATAHEIAATGLTGASQPLPFADRIQALFGRHSIAGIQAHVGGPAAAASQRLGASAYATGNSVVFAGPPDLHTAAHEAAHVVQQRVGVHLKDGMGQPGDAHEQHADAVADRVVQGKSAEGLLDQYTASASSSGNRAVQCSFAGSFPIPGSTSIFEIDLQTRNRVAVTPPALRSGMQGSIRFIPGRGSPNANVIAFHQIGRIEDLDGADINTGNIPKDRAARGALGTPGIRTAADPARGVEGGFVTDVEHRADPTVPPIPTGSALSPRYPVGPVTARASHVGGTQQPKQGGDILSDDQIPGFKRSDDPQDIKSATMYDFPAIQDEPADVDAEAFNLAFESMARGEDANFSYGTVKWGFGVRAGKVTNERITVLAGDSATFREAQERHRDFYIHEPVTFYFALNSDALNATEAAKIDAFLAYLTRNPDVHMALEGFSGQLDGASAHNVELSRRRASAVRANLIARGIAAARIDPPVVTSGASTAATDATSEVPAGTGDQGRNTAVGADQRREANRWANRRVVLTFRHVPAAGAAPAPAGPAAPAAKP